MIVLRRIKNWGVQAPQQQQAQLGIVLVVVISPRTMGFQYHYGTRRQVAVAELWLSSSSCCHPAGSRCDRRHHHRGRRW
jgi:hypothetical protein